MEAVEIFHTAAIWSPSFFTVCGICEGIMQLLSLLKLFFCHVPFVLFEELPFVVGGWGRVHFCQKYYFLLHSNSLLLVTTLIRP